MAPSRGLETAAVVVPALLLTLALAGCALGETIKHMETLHWSLQINTSGHNVDLERHLCRVQRGKHSNRNNPVLGSGSLLHKPSATDLPGAVGFCRTESLFLSLCYMPHNAVNLLSAGHLPPCLLFCLSEHKHNLQD